MTHRRLRELVWATDSRASLFSCAHGCWRPTLSCTPMNSNTRMTRRAVLRNLGVVTGAMLAFGASSPAATVAAPGRRAAKLPRSENTRKQIFRHVFKTPMVDTHEHLPDESQRLQRAGAGSPRCDDWALLLSHYLDSDLRTAGMSKVDLDRFLSPDVDPMEKWSLLEPWWPAVKNTGYAQAVRISMRELYGVENLSAMTVAKVQTAYDRLRKPGFYQEILRDHANLHSCQVNCLTGTPFRESTMPTLLMQDLSIVGMFAGPAFRQYAAPAGIEVKSLADWHRVIKWWFEKYGKYAVAVKSQNAYARNIDYARVPAEQAEPGFNKLLANERVSVEERKLVEDHLFWYAVDEATAHHLPVKLHTGYYAGQNGMPLSRLLHNAGSAADLCRLSPNTQFVFMHICYPHYEELLGLVKHYTNAHVDMCWSWIINPIAAKDYFKKHIVTAPANKLLPFGGDYIPVEPVLGHAVIARQGMAQALSELVEEGWLTASDAIDLIEPVLNGNAHRIFQLEKKTELLSRAAWGT